MKLFLPVLFQIGSDPQMQPILGTRMTAVTCQTPHSKPDPNSLDSKSRRIQATVRLAMPQNWINWSSERTKDAARNAEFNFHAVLSFSPFPCVYRARDNRACDTGNSYTRPASIRSTKTQQET